MASSAFHRTPASLIDVHGYIIQHRDYQDLSDRITMYLTRYFLANETNANQGRFLAQFELSGLGWQESEHFVDNLRRVTAADVQRVAHEYLQDIQYAVLGNPALIDRKAFAVAE